MSDFSKRKTVFCLEIANNYKLEDAETIDQIIKTLLSKLNYNESTMFISEVSYLDFVDRFHVSELKLREKGLWNVPHPWLNLLVPKSKIHSYNEKWNVKCKEHMQQQELEANAREQARERDRQQRII
ncbi:cytokinin dehydrogenase 1-like protein [Tanacetum coccineum]